MPSGTLRRYRRWIIISVATCVAAVILLLLLSRGQQSEPFRYMIF